MKRAVFLFFVLISTKVCAGDERDDFGFRMTAGAVSGIANEIMPEASAWADFYFLSPDVRMLFGFNMMQADDARVPLASLQAIGAEVNWPLFSRQAVLFGLRYNKAYLRDESALLQPQRGMSFHVGYKYRIFAHHDLVAELGQQYQPFKKKFADTLSLADKTYFLRLGWEIYF